MLLKNLTTPRNREGGGTDFCQKKNLFVSSREKKQEIVTEDGKEVMKSLRYAFINNMFDSVKKVFDLLVWNDRHGLSSREFFVDEDGNSPMFWAVNGGHMNLVKLLVEKYRFPVNDQNNDGRTVLVASILGGYTEMALYLLEKGANPNICNLKRESPLHVACCLNLSDICEALLSNGAWIETEDESGETPLHWAVREENLEVIEILLRNGANPDHQNEDDETPRDMSKLSTSNFLSQLIDSFAGTISFSEIDSLVPKINIQPLMEIKEENEKGISKSQLITRLKNKEMKCK